MKLLLFLLYLTARGVNAQLECGERILGTLDEKFFDALRKVESDGDVCKMSATKLGPYQISEAYYDEAVEDNQELKTGGIATRAIATYNDIELLSCYN